MPWKAQFLKHFTILAPFHKKARFNAEKEEALHDISSGNLTIQTKFWCPSFNALLKWKSTKPNLNQFASKIFIIHYTVASMKN